MGLVRQGRVDTMGTHAQRALMEGRTVFVCQIRGPMSHSPKLTRPIPDAAEVIEQVERTGWHLDKMDSLVYENNTTIVCLFRRR